MKARDEDGFNSFGAQTLIPLVAFFHFSSVLLPLAVHFTYAAYLLIVAENRGLTIVKLSFEQSKYWNLLHLIAFNFNCFSLDALSLESNMSFLPFFNSSRIRCLIESVYFSHCASVSIRVSVCVRSS